MELPKRNNIRLQNYDYSLNGAYFVTICTKDRKCIFGNVVGEDIILPKILPHTQLNVYGKIVDKAINEIENRYEHIYVNKYIIMPNHIHMIILINSNENGRMISSPTLSTVIGSMKRWVSKQIGTPIWQKSFYDHVIRTQSDYDFAWEYTENNSLKWKLDKYYIK